MGKRADSGCRKGEREGVELGGRPSTLRGTSSGDAPRRGASRKLEGFFFFFLFFFFREKVDVIFINLAYDGIGALSI